MIREIKVEDAASFLQLSKQLDEETKFMLYEPGERKFTAEQQEQMIQRFVENKYATILVAVEEENSRVYFSEWKSYSKKETCSKY